MTEIGLQLSSLTPYLDTEEHIKASFEKIAGIGYRFVQLQGVPSHIDNGFIAATLKSNGLTCVATQEDYPFGFGEHPEAAIERALVCGARYLAFALIPKDIDSVDKLRYFAEKIGVISDNAEKAGLVFSFHPIGCDYRLMDGIPVFERLLGFLPDSVHLTFCLQAAFGSSSDIPGIFDRYNGRTELVHFKDNIVLPDGKKQLVPLGEGCHDWQPYFRMCCRNNVKYVFAEQERWNRDAFDCVKASYEYLKK